MFTKLLAKSRNCPRIFINCVEQKIAKGGIDAYFNFEFYETLEAHENGVIYNPLDHGHSLRVNLSWVLGLVHQKRNVLVLSEVISFNIWRNDGNVRPGKTDLEFSAFAAEMAALVRVGYEVRLEGGQIIFDSRSLQEVNQLEISDITPGIDDYVQALHKVVLIIFQEIKSIFSQQKFNPDWFLDYLEYWAKKQYGEAWMLDNHYFQLWNSFQGVDVLSLDWKKILEIVDVLVGIGHGCIYQDRQGKAACLEDFSVSKAKFDSQKVLAHRVVENNKPALANQ